MRAPARDLIRGRRVGESNCSVAIRRVKDRALGSSLAEGVSVWIGSAVEQLEHLLRRAGKHRPFPLAPHRTLKEIWLLDERAQRRYVVVELQVAHARLLHPHNLSRPKLRLGQKRTKPFLSKRIDKVVHPRKVDP